MLTETTLVQPSALFLFAHQDDEFGVFQKIMDEQRQGRHVYCAYLTDGAFAGQSSLRRNRESLTVLTKLGVQEEDIFLPDICFPFLMAACLIT